MRTEEFNKMRDLEARHWWFLGRRFLLRFLRRVLVQSDDLILDVGCGTGLGASELGTNSQVIGLDVSIDAFRVCDWNRLGMPCVGSAERMPFKNDSFQLVVALDVLEHLERVDTALKEIYRVCKPGGFLLVLVPAYGWLWSSHDEVLGHKRRYTASSLASALRSAGFQIVRLSYVVTFVFPLAALVRLIRRLARRTAQTSDMAPVPGGLNLLLSLIMRVEVFFLRWVNMPFGLSALAIAKRPEEAFAQCSREVK